MRHQLAVSLLSLLCLASVPPAGWGQEGFREGPGAEPFLRDATGVAEAQPFLAEPGPEWRVAGPGDDSGDASGDDLGGPASAPEAEGPCAIADIRLGGQPGDAYIGPTCNNDGTYRTCFYVTGSGLPANNASYMVQLDGVTYPIAFTVQLSSATVVVCVTGVPSGSVAVDVTVQLAAGCSWTEADLYTAPTCPDLTICTISDIRLGGQAGDAYIGPTCNNDGTYRTCFYVTGTALPASSAGVVVTLDGVAYGVAFFVALSQTQVVVCVTGVPSGPAPVDVTVQVAADCSHTENDMFPSPFCPDLTVCAITSIRLGGQPGDAYIGPTCSNDGTYRTCFYVAGQNLPASNPAYDVSVNGVSYPVAFTVQLSSALVVVCVSGIPSTSETDVDVRIRVATACSAIAYDLYDPPACPGSAACAITNVRLGGLAGDAFIGPTCNNDGTYRTCFYVTGVALPTSTSGYLIALDGVDYPIAFSAQVSPTVTVLCATGLPPGRSDIDVRVRLASGCGLAVPDLYSAPATCPGACKITDIRLGGLPGDAYIGPTCNNDGTYRTCFYLSGTNLPAPGAYAITINRVSYPIAFAVQLSSSQVVVCVTDLPPGAMGVDVYALLAPGCDIKAIDLYDAPQDCTPLTEGCGPDFWKAQANFPAWPIPYRPSTSFAAVFGLVPGVSSGTTLVGALRAPGDGIQSLMRHAAAALLNAEAGLAFGASPGEVVALFQQAVAPGGANAEVRDHLAGLNGQGCPLD